MQLDGTKTPRRLQTKVGESQRKSGVVVVRIGHQRNATTIRPPLCGGSQSGSRHTSPNRHTSEEVRGLGSCWPHG
eukprot:gene6858-biopygen23949